MQDTDDVVAEIEADHRRVEALFARLEAGEGPTRELVEQLTVLLSQHSVAEQEQVYPLLPDLPGGDELAGHALDEHAEIERTLADLASLDPGDVELRPTVRRLAEAVGHHVAEEEGRILPLLRTQLGEERLQVLAEEFRQARRAAPTRPHPLAPDTPPFSTVVGKAAAAVDRVRDDVRDEREARAAADDRPGTRP